MGWCSHDFVRNRGGRTCSKCGYRQRRRRRTGYRKWRRQGRQGRWKAPAAVLAAVAVAAGALVASEVFPGYREPVALGGAQAGPGEAGDAAPAGPGPGAAYVARTGYGAEAGSAPGISDGSESAKAAAKIELSALYDHALELVNEDRDRHGLEPVALSQTGSAQDHADDMMEIGYYSHWHSEGVKPYATYTKHGGTGYVAENIATSWCSGYCSPIDPFETIKEHQWGMVYDDADSDWGHRDNILDPARTHVNFGIAYSGSKLYFVQHFESNGAGWSDVRLKDGRLVMEGTAPWGGVPHISIYRDPEPEPLSARELDTVKPYSLPFYEMGEMVGMVVKVPSGGTYQQCPNGDLLTQDGCYPYSFWHADTWGDGRIRLTVDVSKWVGTGGLHSALVFLPGADGVHVPSSVIALEYLEQG